MTEPILHQAENSEDTQQHLQENAETFETHCLILLKMMLRGTRLTTQMVTDMHISDRRLRNLFEAGKCEKEWMKNEKGKRTHVEYFIPIPKPPTKGQVIAMYKQTDLFE